MYYRALLYHDLVDPLGISGFSRQQASSYKLTKENFIKQIKYCFEFISNESFHSRLGYVEDNNLLFTFDDGGSSMLDIADILESFGFFGYFFISTSFIGKNGFLNKPQIKELHDRGHIVGSHSHSHPHIFSKLSFDKMKHEWETSKDILENILSYEVDSCSLPGGEMNKNGISTAGLFFKNFFCSEPYIRPYYSGNILILGRISIQKQHSHKYVLDVLKSRFLIKQKIIRILKNIIKKFYYLNKGPYD